MSTPTTSSKASTSTGSTQRSRADFRSIELNTIPKEVTILKAAKSPLEQGITCLTNIININPMPKCVIYQYRVDFEPDVESITLKRELFKRAAASLFKTTYTFDGKHDARSKFKLPKEKKTVSVSHESGPNKKYDLIIKNVGAVVSPFEMVRLYNLQMNDVLRKMNFFQVNRGAYVNQELSIHLPDKGIKILAGYKTSANVHENNANLMTLEPVSKIMQEQNVLQYMDSIEEEKKDISIVKNKLQGKLVVTSYNKKVYKIEDVMFNLNPTSTFLDEKKNSQISYLDYYRNRYNVEIKQLKQPLLLAVENNKKRRHTETQMNDIKLIPELCNIAGLTDDNRLDNKLKIKLVEESQIPPQDRVKQLEEFLKKLNTNNDVKNLLNQWGYSYGEKLLTVPARIIETEIICLGSRDNTPILNWKKVNPQHAGFDNLIMHEQCKVVPPPPKLKMIIHRKEFGKQECILDNILEGFNKVGLEIARQEVEIIVIQAEDRGDKYAAEIKRLPKDTTLAIVILANQDKEKYDAIKKAATAELGMLTQVVTSRVLIKDARKAKSVAVKIGVQVVAKLGGEPWWINLPLGGSMVCGYDTYHDTSNRGRSFGAFIASMNERYSRWWSKADIHDKIDELSSHIAENVVNAMTRYYHKNNKKYPSKIFIYRDGVGDGQLNHVYEIEVKQIEKAVQNTSNNTQLCFIVVNKRIGARFYWKLTNRICNPCPGTVIDDVVTRKERYDFYLISQSTRQGTVTPTYYNILHDNTALEPAFHQKMAYKMCLAYYNWTGTVRVPAPCQYAHKLALLCGEHIHNVPNAALDDKLHFL